MKPNVGMVYPVAAFIDSYTPGTSISYEDGFVVAEARGATLTWETSDGEFYGDDVLLDTDKGVSGFTIDFEPSGLKTAVRAKLLGEKEASTDVYRITNANPPDLGFGYVRVMREDAEGSVTVTYEAWWFYKVKFSISSEETRTKEKNIEWRVPTLNGKGAGVYLDSSGDIAFADHEDFTTLDAAKAWLNSLADISGSGTST
jgi:hypothetical protein